MRPLNTIPLVTNILSKLQDEGYLFCEDIFDENKVVKNEVNELLSNFPKETWNNLAELINTPQHKSAFQILQDQKKIEKIITFSQAVDQVLGGGVNLGEVIEFCGAPGCGKTQFCLQLCIAVQLPCCLGGVQGEAIYIDTNSGFTPTRLKELAESCYKLFLNASKQQSSLEMELKNVNVCKLLGGVHYIDVHDNIQLLSIVTLIEDFINTNHKVKLVVIDCLTFPFLDQFISSTLLRTQQICRIVRKLQDVATKFNIAIVITNQLTTKIIQQEAKLAPALGENYAHTVSKRIILGNQKNSNFSAAVIKSSYLPEFCAEFQVTSDGVRDIL